MPINSENILSQINNIYESSRKYAYDRDANLNVSKLVNNIKYPLLKLNIDSYGTMPYSITDLSYGIIHKAGEYQNTLTRVDLFYKYYKEQIDLMIQNQECQITIEKSMSTIPLPFIDESLIYNFPSQNMKKILPNLKIISEKPKNMLSFFHAERVDYSISRLEHYTKTNAQDFQEYIILVNYEMYISLFKEIFEGHYISSQPSAQMPTLHSHKYNISVINIGVGPSNAKNITDHLAVLRSKLWVMLGHCAGLQKKHQVGDYIIAQGYVRDDHIMDDLLPKYIPIPNIRILEKAITDSCEQRIHFGTVISTADRNWESNFFKMKNIIYQSNAVGLEMESATVACNAYLHKIPYVTFLCISDIPTHGVLKLRSMAEDFYNNKLHEHAVIMFYAVRKIQNLCIHEILNYIRNSNDPAWR